MAPTPYENINWLGLTEPALRSWFSALRLVNVIAWLLIRCDIGLAEPLPRRFSFAV